MECTLHSISEQSAWEALDENLLKINVDGSFSEKGTGIGLVVRSHLGQVEPVMAEKTFGSLNAEHVECIAFLQTLQFSRNLGITQFLVEGNASNVVQKFRS